MQTGASEGVLSNKGSPGVSLLLMHEEGSDVVIARHIKLWSHRQLRLGATLAPPAPFAGIRRLDQSTLLVSLLSDSLVSPFISLSHRALDLKLRISLGPPICCSTR